MKIEKHFARKAGLWGVCLLLSGFVWNTSNARAEELAGLDVGDKAPLFELKDQRGKSVKLADLLEKGSVAVVFHRSAGWCPFCQKHLISLQEGLGDIQAAGLQLVAISYDSVDVLAGFAEKRDITYPLLSDTGSETIKAWNLLNKEASGRTEGIPHPMTYVVARNGAITAKLGHEGYRERHSVQELVDAAKSAVER